MHINATQVQYYERFTPLLVEPVLPNGYADVQPGDCVVSFSRKAIYTTKKQIEEATGLRACVVYGSLPAETRRHQARCCCSVHWHLRSSAFSSIAQTLRITSALIFRPRICSAVAFFA